MAQPHTQPRVSGQLLLLCRPQMPADSADLGLLGSPTRVQSCSTWNKLYRPRLSSKSLLRLLPATNPENSCSEELNLGPPPSVLCCASLKCVAHTIPSALHPSTQGYQGLLFVSPALGADGKEMSKTQQGLPSGADR